MLARKMKQVSPDSLLMTSLLHVILGASLVAGIVFMASDHLHGIEVNSGFHHYAESRSPLSTNLLPLPFNTLVNLGYVVVGIIWLLRIRNLCQQQRISTDVAYLFYVFSWMAILYGPAQFVRIVTQWRAAGILDQWYTLPIFAWVGISCTALNQPGRFIASLAFLITTLSVSSYGLAVLHRYGFEVALALHIIGVVAVALSIHRRQSSGQEYHRRQVAFLGAVVCCAGFVMLKLADHHLADFAPVPFTILSGHFWSKIADFMQIHYACRFLEACVAQQHRDSRNTSSVGKND